MRLSNSYERLQELIGLIDLSPSANQIVRYLSNNLDPFGEIAGVSWMTLQDTGLLNLEHISGLSTRLDPNVQITHSDDNVVSESLRTGRLKIFDMNLMYHEYRRATHRESLSSYSTGIVLPVTDRIVIGCAMNSDFINLLEYEGYFECVRLVLSLWQTKLNFNKLRVATRSNNQTSELTTRQVEILIMLRAGSTNAAIGESLGFSESLIRQETIIIYRKLGVKGRREILSSSIHNNELSAYTWRPPAGLN